MGWLVIVVYWVHGLIYTRIAFSDMVIARQLKFWVAGCVGAVLLGGLTGALSLSLGLTGPVVGAVCLTLGGLCHCGFLAKGFAELIVEGGRRARGDHLLVVKKTYDQAEAAEKRHDWEAAERLYREEVDGDPADAEVRVRLAEILVRQERLEAAVALFEQALRLLEEPEKKGPLAFRLSEVLLKSGNRAAASAVLEQALVELEGTRYHAFARKRLDALG